MGYIPIFQKVTTTTQKHKQHTHTQKNKQHTQTNKTHNTHTHKQKKTQTTTHNTTHKHKQHKNKQKHTHTTKTRRARAARARVLIRKSTKIRIGSVTLKVGNSHRFHFLYETFSQFPFSPFPFYIYIEENTWNVLYIYAHKHISI